MTQEENPVIGAECRFVVHIPSNHNDIPDIHYVKEQVHYKDGTIKPNIRLIKNFKRKFWITKPNKRNHEQKKEYEHIDNLLEYESTESDLRNKIAKALNKNWSNERLQKLCTSPYVYGIDISSTALVKKKYQEKFPNLVSNYSVATFDIETDVVNGTNEPIICSLIFKNIIYITTTKEYVRGFSSPEDRLKSLANKYIGDYISKRNMEIEFNISDNVLDMIKAVFNKAHELKPDFLAIWNMDFDIPRILETIKEHGGNPIDIIADPNIPRELRICKYKRGSQKMITASGKVKPKNPEIQWHTLECTASFYVIDSMCTYKHIRSQKQAEPSYSLDAILGKELKISKLKFTEADSYTGLQWHQFMQTNYKLEYIVYNIFDSLSMLELDDKTKDLCTVLPSLAGVTEFEMFKSQPKRIADAFHFYCMDRGYILGTVGETERREVKSKQDEEGEEVPEEFSNSTYDKDDEDSEDENQDILDLKNWIITLPAHLVVPGLKCIQEDINMATSIRGYVFDSDEVSAYPTAIWVLNISKETTKRELINIQGIDETTFRMQNLNLVLGKINAIEYSTTMFKLPKARQLLEMMNN